MTKKNHLVLSSVMFLQYMTLGTVIPIITLYFKDYLGFSGSQIGLILSCSSFAIFLAPLMTSLIVDRLIHLEKLFMLLHFIGGGLIFLLYFQKQFIFVFLIYLFYILAHNPTQSLVNAIVFRSIATDRNKFGIIRMWGTIGWIFAAWFFSLFILQKTRPDNPGEAFHTALLLSAFLGFFTILVSIFLPRIRPEKKHQKAFFPREAVEVIKNKKVILLILLSFTVMIVDKYYYFGTAPFLSQSGFSPRFIMPIMGIGQIIEIFGMLLLKDFIYKFGFKKLMIAGIIAEILRFSFFSLGHHPALIFIGIGFHGIAYAFFFGTAFIYLDTFCDELSRSSVHQLYSFFYFGFSTLIGNLLAGKTMDLLTDKTTNLVNFSLFWSVPLALSILVLLLIQFQKRKNRKEYQSTRT